MPRDESDLDESPLTVKQQRAAQRAEKLAAFRRKEAARKRNRAIGLAATIVAAVAAVAVVATVIVVNAQPEPERDPAALGEVRTWDDLDSTHVTTPVDYESEYGMFPPAGGRHAAAWLNCGVYAEPQPEENAVHSLEHGAVWATYDDALADDAVQDLREALPSSYAILSPYPGLDSPMAISAWGAQLKFDDPADPALAAFLEEYWRSADAPEPGAPCTGALDGPGKVA